MRSAKLPCPKVLQLSSSSSVKSALSELFGSRNRPDALFTANNASTIWVIEALQELKIEIGKDVALRLRRCRLLHPDHPAGYGRPSTCRRTRKHGGSATPAENQWRI